MRVALVGTYPPTVCGIATFTADVESSLVAAGLDVTVISVGRAGSAGVAIDKLDRDSYRRAAIAVADAGFDVVLIEHEFGIFGGDAGEFIIDFTERLRVPWVLTLHTVLSRYTDAQQGVVRRLCESASAVTVFTATAARMLVEQQLVPSNRVHVIQHGAPVELHSNHREVQARRHFSIEPNAPVMSTFGLLSPGKGIELALRAMVDIVAVRPDAMYVVAGQTHPEVARRDGEAYRHALLRMVHDLALDNHVVFLDRFLSVTELGQLLAITDVFCTPYVGSEQAVSGALTFAIAAGCPVVSTPYQYAVELLSGGAGTLVAFGNAKGLAAAVIDLFTLDEPTRRNARENAKAGATSLTWPAVGRALADVLAQTASSHIERRPLRLRERVAPAPSTLHLRVLLDDTAMLQHAESMIPRIEEGYCVDDVGRCLPVLADLARRCPPEVPLAHIAIARQLAFLRAAAHPLGNAMYNFMSWERRWLDLPHGGDHVGRAVWGLGELASRSTPQSGDAHDLMLRLLHDFEPAAASPRTLAYTALGVVAATEVDSELDELLERMRPTIQAWQLQRKRWPWFEPKLSYDNARLPEVMLRVGHRLDDAQLIAAGAASLSWLERLCRRGTHYRFPGHLGVEYGQDTRHSGDEQPLEAVAMADAHAALWAVTGAVHARVVVERSWSWFLGNNRLGAPMGDLTTGACHDGLGELEVNRNCGAESTLSFLRCWQTANRLEQPTDTIYECYLQTTATSLGACEPGTTSSPLWSSKPSRTSASPAVATGP